MPTARQQRNPAGESPQPVRNLTPDSEPWRAANPGAIRCNRYSEHREYHRRFEGGWRCFACFPLGEAVS